MSGATCHNLVLISLSVLLLLAGRRSAGAQPLSTAPARLDYPSFKIIADRNIFNPHRRAGEVNRPGRQTRTTRVDSFSLVGIMSYSKGPFAFFDGSSSEYRKVLKPGDSIAGYKVTNIQPNAAKLTSSTNQVELRVGMQMRREENGTWHVAAASRTSTPAGAATSTRAGGRGGMSAATEGGGTNAEPADALGATDQQVALTDAPADVGTTNAEPSAASDSTETDPVLRRLMERRNQELNR